MNGASVGAQMNAFSTPPAPGFRVNGGASRTGFQRSIELRGPAGRLEAVLNQGAAHARFAALVCHPHPLGGGTLHNKVVYHAMKVMNAPEWGFCAPVLRFNFRGTGLSEGAHDGVAEAEDVLSALDWLGSEFQLPVVAAGFSFGAAMIWSACCGRHSEKNIRGLALLGLPTNAPGRDYRYPQMEHCAIPKLFLSGDRDQFAPVESLKALAGKAAAPRRIDLVHGADHFFSGHLDAMQQALAAWLKEPMQ